jgi:hypothetical protein
MNENKPTKLSETLGTIGIGLFMLIVGSWLAWDTLNELTRMEAEGGTVRLHRIVITLYDLGGKWLAAGGILALAVLMGGGITLMGIVALRQHLRRKKE